MQNNKINYVHILGASHSGSTLLGMILNGHPDIVSIGELTSAFSRNLEEYYCSCGKLLTTCPFWGSVSETLSHKHPRFNLSDFGMPLDRKAPAWVHRLARIEHRGLFIEKVRNMFLQCSASWRNHCASLREMIPDFAENIQKSMNAKYLVDTSKLALNLKLLQSIPRFDVKVIYLIRDGRAVSLTYMDQDNFADAKDPALRRGGKGRLAAPTASNLSMERAADEWRRCIVSAEFALANTKKSQWISVHYEDLCSKTEETLEKIFRFIGVEESLWEKNFRDVQNHFTGNGMRLDSTSEISLDERWRTVLSTSNLNSFERVAGDVNLKLGYR